MTKTEPRARKLRNKDELRLIIKQRAFEKMMADLANEKNEQDGKSVL